MYDTLFICYSGALILSLLFTMLLIFQKPGRQQQLALLVAVLISITAFGYWFEIQARDAVSSLIGQKLKYVGGCHLYYLMLVFMASYSGVRVPKWIRGILICFNTSLMLFVMFFEYHTLFYTSYTFTMINGMPHVEKEYGILHTLYIISMAGYTLAMFVLAIWHIWIKRATIERLTAIGMLLIVVFPTTTYVIGKLQDSDIDLVPFGMLLAEVILYVMIYRLRLYIIRDLAKDCAFDTMEDSVIVTNTKYEYLDSNPMAKKLYTKLEVARSGDELLMIDEELYSVLKKKQTCELRKHDSIYSAKVKDIVDSKGRTTGHVLWIRDVTNERQRAGLLENYQRNLKQEVTKRTQGMRVMQEDMLIRFANIMENRGSSSNGHSRRVALYMRLLVSEMQRRGLYKDTMTAEFLNNIRMLTPIHDIGKIKLPAAMLNKEGIPMEEYTREERRAIKEHPMEGLEVIESNFSDLEDKEFYSAMKEIVLYHHEKWDGSGYPEGLSGIKIPLAARMVAVPDLYDMLLMRSQPITREHAEEAFEMLAFEKGRALDPTITDCFISIKSQVINLICKEMTEIEVNI